MATAKKSVLPEHPDLSGFNYKELKGDSFVEYAKLVGEPSLLVKDEDDNYHPVTGRLRLDDMYDFQLFKMVPILKDRYKGIKDTPRDFAGLTMKNDTPVHTTRIPVKSALAHNGQIVNAHSVAGHGTYYLLKK